jgi:uncharacterized ferredoxin-like protein
MAEIKSESVADFIPESVADFVRKHKAATTGGLLYSVPSEVECAACACHGCSGAGRFLN